MKRLKENTYQTDNENLSQSHYVVSMRCSMINNSEKLFTPEVGWKIKGTHKVHWKKTSWHVRGREIYVNLCQENVWKTP